MAIDISDMEVADDMYLGDRLPIEMLFRAIEERWSVVADRLEDLPAHPLAYDRFPTRQDRLDAIRANVCALAPYFVNLDDDANQPTGWARCPLPYSADDIARSGLGDDGHGHVLLVPSRGAVWGEWEASWYKSFLKSAAYWLAKFRYVYAGPWTCCRGKLSRTVSGAWHGRGLPTEWVGASALATEGYTINGEDFMTTWDGDEWIRCADYEEVAAMATDGDDAIVVENIPAEPSWGIPSTGIPITVNASADVGRYVATDADGTYATVADEWGWGETIGIGFGISNVPARCAVANPFGFRAELLFVYAPTAVTNGERRQETYVTGANGQKHDEWREILGNFQQSEIDIWVDGVHARDFDADFDPATGRKVIVNDETQPADPFDDSGTNVSVTLHRYNEPDSFGVFPIGDPEAQGEGDQVYNPVGRPNRIEHKLFLEPGTLHEEVWGNIFENGGSATGKLLIRSTFDMAAMVEEARGALYDNGPGDNPLKPTPPGFNRVVSYSATFTYWDAGCRIVPILDFGEAFKTNEEEEVEDWTGNRPHDEEGEGGGEEEYD